MRLTTARYFTIALLLALGACATPGGPSDEEKLAAIGATRLDAAQVRARVVGNTEAWQHGGAWYRADGTLRVKWLKTYLEGSWEISADGTLCYQLPRWQRRCHFYMDNDGIVLLLDEGVNIGERELYDGDKLHALDRYSIGKGNTR